MPKAFYRLMFVSLAATAVTITAVLTLRLWIAILIACAAGCAIAWSVSIVLSRRLQTVVKMAHHYATADLSRWPVDYGNDDIGQIIRAMDEAIQGHKRRLLELGRHRARMEAILAEMAEGVLVVDRHGRVQLINLAAERLLGRVAVGDHYIETLRQPSVVAELTAALRGERPDPLEVALESERRSLLAHATPASESAGGGAVLVLHDITALRTADRIRRDFVANVSHELRTPLTAVRGYIEALNDEEVSREDRRQFLAVVARHTDRMERLVRDLLRLVRIEGGQETLNLAECGSEALFRSVLAEIAGPIQSRKLRIEIEISPGAQLIAGDVMKLQDALRNLLENAINYSPPGGRIEMKAATEGRWSVLSVRDEGPGIPETDLVRVFERFYRVDKSRARDSSGSARATAVATQVEGGTGLGLSIVKHLIELHGGHVGVENRQPHGAVFTIYLPRGH